MVAFADAFNAHDWDTVLALCSDDVEFWTLLEGRVEPEPLRGRAGVERWRASEDEAFESRALEGLTTESLAPGLVLATATARGIGRASGVEVVGPAAWLFELRDGLIVRWRSFAGRDEALAQAERTG